MGRKIAFQRRASVQGQKYHGTENTSEIVNRKGKRGRRESDSRRRGDEKAGQTDQTDGGTGGRTSRHYVKGRYQSRCRRIGRTTQPLRRARRGGGRMGLAASSLAQPQRSEGRGSSFAFDTNRGMDAYCHSGARLGERDHTRSSR